MSVDGTASADSQQGQPVHERFVDIAARFPDAVAIIDPDGREATYGQLHRQAVRLASSLREAGVTSNVRVAIYLDRSIELIVAVNAVLMAGGAYVPLDMSYPPQRLTHL